MISLSTTEFILVKQRLRLNPKQMSILIAKNYFLLSNFINCANLRAISDRFEEDAYAL